MLALTLLAAPAASAQPILTPLDPSYVLGQRSLAGDVATSIRFANLMDQDVDLFWMNYDGVETFYGTLVPDQVWDQQTFLTHPWLIRSHDLQAPIVGFLPTDGLAIANIRPFAAVVPEPSTIALLAGGMLALGGLSLRRRRLAA